MLRSCRGNALVAQRCKNAWPPGGEIRQQCLRSVSGGETRADELKEPMHDIPEGPYRKGTFRAIKRRSMWKSRRGRVGQTKIFCRLKTCQRIKGQWQTTHQRNAFGRFVLGRGGGNRESVARLCG